MSAGAAWLEENVNVLPTPVVLVTSNWIVFVDPCASVVEAEVGNPERRSRRSC